MTAALIRSLGYTNFGRNPMYRTGKELATVGFRVTAATTGNAGDQYILGGPFTLDDRIARIIPWLSAALTGATSCNIGFYKSTDNGATIGNLSPVVASGGNEIWSAVDFHLAPTLGLDLITAKNSSLDTTKAIRDLLGSTIGSDQEPPGGVFLVLTLTNANSAGGVLDWDIQIEEATTR